MFWDRVAGLAVVALGVAYWRAASALPRPLLQQDVGPEVFPHLIAGALVGLGVLLAGGPLLRRAVRWPAARPQPSEAELGPPPDVAAIVLVFAGLVGYTLAYERLGFILASALFMAFEIVVLEVERARWLWAVPVVVLLPVLLYLLFDTLLGVSLPAGLLG